MSLCSLVSAAGYTALTPMFHVNLPCVSWLCRDVILSLHPCILLVPTETCLLLFDTIPPCRFQTLSKSARVGEVISRKDVQLQNWRLLCKIRCQILLGVGLFIIWSIFVSPKS